MPNSLADHCLLGSAHRIPSSCTVKKPGKCSALFGFPQRQPGLPNLSQAPWPKAALQSGARHRHGVLQILPVCLFPSRAPKQKLQVRKPVIPNDSHHVLGWQWPLTASPEDQQHTLGAFFILQYLHHSQLLPMLPYHPAGLASYTVYNQNSAVHINIHEEIHTPRKSSDTQQAHKTR